MVIVFQQFQFGLAVIVDLEEKHPHQLTDALGVAIDADFFTHDVLNGLDNTVDVTHADLSI